MSTRPKSRPAQFPNQKTKKRLPKKIMDDAIAGLRGGNGFKKNTQSAPLRTPYPDLPKGNTPLSQSEQWRSLLWMIDTAEQHGKHALRGLTILLARKILADGLTTLFFDARPHRSPSMLQGSLLWAESQPLTRDGKTLRELVTRKPRSRHAELSKTAFIANVWEPWRLARALQAIGPDKKQNPWIQDYNNHHAVLWHPWPLVWVEGGNHSATAAAINGGGIMECDMGFDLSPVLAIISTDGINWHGEDGLFIGPVESLAMAGIIAIGKRLMQ